MRGPAPGRDLSHLYHYYLHGPAGNRGGSTGSDGVPASQPARKGSGVAGAPPLPEIVLTCLAGGRPAWRVNLAEVADDLESQCLQVRRLPQGGGVASPDTAASGVSGT